MQGLNPQQQAAVRHVDTPLLVLAGAGSGKTRVIVEKIVHLIDDKGLPARGIWAVTFTNKAAREMGERIGQRLPAERRRGLNISTFHTLGLKLIRRETRTLGLRPGFTVLDAEDSLNLIKSLLQQNEAAAGLLEPKEAQWTISQWKNDLLTPEQAMAASEDEVQAAAASLYSDYARQLTACNALDFDDLIKRPVELLRDDPEARERWQRRVRYLLVDEYQDTNASQYELVRLLVGPLGRLTAVGDDHQSIYAWRGARPENLSHLARDFPRLETIKLEQNYRSVNTVLTAANQLIANDSTTQPKNLWSAVGPGEEHRVLVCDTADDEAERIATDIIHRHFKDATPYRHFAILFRGNHQARLLEQQLRKLSIPYLLTGGQSFFERAEVKDAMAYLRLMANPSDDAALLRIINTPRRGIGPTTLERLGQIARERHTHLAEAARSITAEQRLDNRVHHQLLQFLDWLDATRRRMDEEPAADAMRALLDEIDYFGYLREQENTAKAAERRWTNLQDWLEWTDRIGTDNGSGETLSLTELVQKMSLLGILEQKTRDQDDDAVRLLTLHAAKGLEFPHVYLSGMEEDLLPHQDCQEEDRLAEERRLCFVGITRAQRSLTFTLTKRRRRYGQWRDVQPSRFLEEIEAELLRWEGVGVQKSEEENRATAAEAMSAIRAMLGKS
ncbi:UvrD-helicase domain-containing protein [Guyparkeria hydrothermalis]|uniref:UvrD-helicase domain-containing protein n=1 Tax=Guyparkeria hydrothermalis TaxID=923 RepID=UPI0020204372|nr:UvrD-helicase domain-containing protein [Guyparkeria hydrothermalis]MCL7743995.1 UvrD-helicase domain-containing protein [Guyparkeria hydrothermalis]